MKRKSLMSALLAGALTSGAAQATLVDRGNGMIYDDVLNITWLQDANYAMTSGYDADGKMTWAEAKTWAADLSFGGYTDWRLPFQLDTGVSGCTGGTSNHYAGTDCGYNVQTVSGSTVYSEMAYMYYVNLGLKARYYTFGGERHDYGIFGDGTRVGQNDVGLIDNLQAGNYWSGTQYGQNTPYPNDAFAFDMNTGHQMFIRPQGSLYAWAVRSGDVASVPEPATWMLLCLGLAGLAATRRRR